MCGLAGAFFWRDGASARDGEAIVRRMTSALSHRGPDGEGLVRLAGAQTTLVFGHRRLAIIDLSERGAQPMRSRTSPIWVVFNGELYNFADLRLELEARGHAFQSSSDTEVLLAAYETWGDEAIDRLDGMFAVALYDGRRDRLLFARDRFGIKPLYVHRHPDGILFASEVRSLLASGLVSRRLRSDALSEYLAYQTVPTPGTLVDGVEMLEPGCRLTVEASGQYRKTRYWDLLDNATSSTGPTSAEATTADVHQLLTRSIKKHLVSDVPVAMFLSGGIDSSAIVMLVSELGLKPRTFSVAAADTPNDDAPFAREVARKFGCDHTEVVLSPEELVRDVSAGLRQFDHPSGDGINTFVVSKAVADAGLKVALSGLGGDEIFGGYPSFGRLRRLAAYSRWWKRSPRAVRQMTAAAVRSVRGSHAGGKLAAVLEGDGSVADAYPVLRQMFGRTDRQSLQPAVTAEVPDTYQTLLREASSRHAERDLMALVSYAEARTYMHDVLLRDSDQMSMAHGLELRVPLLDHQLAEYVVGLPEALKGGEGLKPLLVKGAGDALPRDVVSRPKRGFVLPFDQWMRRDLHDLCAHHLEGGHLARRAGFDPGAVSAIWRGFLSDSAAVTWSRPWTLVALGVWLEQHDLSV
jgi:asparagine synthase (glutamine-hydrolysing)